MQNQIPSSAFDDIINELKRRPIADNQYRDKAGSGRSQSFGIVNRRSLAPHYSRQNWLRPYLYHTLLEFGSKYVDISYNSITINQNYKAAPHRDKNNKGNSFLVAFGSYVGGELNLLEGDLSGSYDICCKPLVTDFSKALHSVNNFVGDRYSLVYYWFENSRSVRLPTWELRKEGKDWFFYCGGEQITKKTGLPHPLRGRKKKESGITKVNTIVDILFD